MNEERQPNTASPSDQARTSAAASLPELVRFDKVTKSFGTGPEAQVAIQDVSFVVHDSPGTGELVSIVGPLVSAGIECNSPKS